MPETFNPVSYCPQSRLPKGLDYKTLDNSVYRCPGCNNLNPNYVEQAIKLEPKNEKKPLLKFDLKGVDVINLSIDNSPKPAQRRGKLAGVSTSIPESSLFIPGFRSGAAEQERQHTS